MERVPADGDEIKREASEGGQGSVQGESGGGGGDSEGEGGEDGEVTAEIGKELEHVVGKEEDVDRGEALGMGAKVFGGDLEGRGGVDGDGRSPGAAEELAGKAFVGKVDALPETRRVEGDGAPLATDLGPRKTVSGLCGPVEPGDTDAKDVFEDFGGEGGDGGELVEHGAHGGELARQSSLSCREQRSAVHWDWGGGWDGTGLFDWLAAYMRAFDPVMD